MKRPLEEGDPLWVLGYVDYHGSVHYRVIPYGAITAAQRIPMPSDYRVGRSGGTFGAKSFMVFEQAATGYQKMIESPLSICWSEKGFGRRRLTMPERRRIEPQPPEGVAFCEQEEGTNVWWFGMIMRSLRWPPSDMPDARLVFESGEWVWKGEAE